MTNIENITLDQAVDAFCLTPSKETALTLQAVAQDYHSDELIEDSTLAQYERIVLNYLSLTQSSPPDAV